MRKLIAIIQLTLDGVMQGPGGPEEDATNGFNQGGWAMRFGDEVLVKTLNDTTSGTYDMLLGRWTYDLFASYWPKHLDTPVGVGFEKATKHVVTSRPEPLNWSPAQRLGGSDVLDGVRKLKSSEGPELHLWGSHKLLQALIAGGLVDEYRLWIAPVIVGRGKRLFEADLPPHDLKLIDTVRTPSGLLLNTYRPN
jgi:dihydrofolate reductase